MLKELKHDDLTFDVLMAELDEHIEAHMVEKCGFFRVGTTLMIQNGDERRYFEVQGNWADPMGCGYIEAKTANDAGDLPEELGHLFVERDEVIFMAMMGDPVAQAIVEKMAEGMSMEIQEVDATEDDEAPPSAFATFFGF